LNCTQNAGRRSWRKVRSKQSKIQGRLRQNFVRLLLVCTQADKVRSLKWLRGFKLLGQREVRPRGSVCVDDALRKQVRNCFPCFGNVGSEKMIERAVLADQNDYMLNGRFSLDFRGRIVMNLLVVLGKSIEVIG